MKNLKFEEQTPMMKQYIKIKENHMDSLLFYRLGDFYELFFDDAKLAAKELDLVLTKRGGHVMCGIPYHVADQYLSKLLKKGYRVAICDQVEDPKEAKGIVKRAVTKVITPGTFTDMDFLDHTKNNYLLSISERAYTISLVYVDYATGECNFVFSHCVNKEEKRKFLFRELTMIYPSEIIVNSAFMKNKHWIEKIKERYEIPIREISPLEKNEKDELLHVLQDSLKNDMDSLSDNGYDIDSILNLFSYIQHTQKSNMDHISRIQLQKEKSYMILDETAKKNLELFENLGTGKKEGSLYKVLDCNITGMGSRKLRQWIDKPLRNQLAIEFRHDMIEELLKDFIFLDDIRNDLDGIYDIERLSVKIATETISPKELVSLKKSLYQLKLLKKKFLNHQSSFICNYGKKIPLCNNIYELIDKTLIDDVPAVVGEQRIITKGYDSELDRLFEAREEGQQWMLDLESREREKTGIKNLKVKFNKILGYYIEVTKTNIDRVPDNYVRKQTLVGSERYFTMELKEMESEILSAKEEALKKQDEVLKVLRHQVHEFITEIQEIADTISTIDVLGSFAIVARRYNYTRPKFNNAKEIHIIEGRHPMVEANMRDIFFVPNDVHMDMKDHLISIITGPNMAGKSTYMRQTAIIAIMAHIGSFVPAKDVNISIIDQIFTRIGASDNLSSGDSTFMIEMKEVATIIENATSDSLIILDEVGRGTGTLDGLSIAWALIEFLHETLRVKTLFATHYHQLTTLEESMDSVENLAILTEQTEEGIIFLRKIIHGSSNQSFGIEVAQLAGVSKKIIDRAKEIFLTLESIENKEKKPMIKDKNLGYQLDLNALQKDEFLKQISNIDINQITPIEGLNLLGEFVNRSKTLREES
ncbi:MAG: DNA mismatch repair protein MutS [Tissierellia bacterium]|nr:DNA mismatch repair protein MutS [Tissierellia bacterium]